MPARQMRTRTSKAMSLPTGSGKNKGSPVHPHFDTEGMTRSINNIHNRLVQTGNPLRPTQEFTNLYSPSAVVTEFPRHR